MCVAIFSLPYFFGMLVPFDGSPRVMEIILWYTWMDVQLTKNDLYQTLVPFVHVMTILFSSHHIITHLIITRHQQNKTISHFCLSSQVFRHFIVPITLMHSPPCHDIALFVIWRKNFALTTMLTTRLLNTNKRTKAIIICSKRIKQNAHYNDDSCNKSSRYNYKNNNNNNIDTPKSNVAPTKTQTYHDYF